MSTNVSFKRTLVTSALPYANGHIHLGHIAGAYLPADVYVRFKRQRGEAVLYIGGSDEYGVPITLSALKEGISPQDVIDRYHTANKDAFERLGISYDIYGRTSWELHNDTTQQFFTKLYEDGYIHQEDMELWYSETSDRFLPDRYVTGTCPKCGADGANGDECESCGAQYAPHDLVNPVANIPGDNSSPILKMSRHWHCLQLGRRSPVPLHYPRHRLGGTHSPRCARSKGQKNLCVVRCAHRLCDQHASMGHRYPRR